MHLTSAANDHPYISEKAFMNYKILFSTIILSAILTTTISCTRNSSAQNRTSINAWGHIELDRLGTALGNYAAGMSSIITVTLSSPDGSYHKEMQVHAGDFSFESVPTDIKLQFTLTPSEQINYNNNKYQAVFIFHKPSLLGGIRGKKIAGYIGDFTINVPGGEITYENRYSK